MAVAQRRGIASPGVNVGAKNWQPGESRTALTTAMAEPSWLFFVAPSRAILANMRDETLTNLVGCLAE